MRIESTGGAASDSETKTPVRSILRKCPICGEVLQPQAAGQHIMTERWIIEQIKKENPDWVQAGGECPKCIDFYSKL